MARAPEPGARDARYPLRFAAAAFLLISITLVLVLFVLPERFVISAGFRESGLSFPVPVTPFAPTAMVAVSARPLPEPPAPEPAASLPLEATPLERAAARLADGRLADAIPQLLLQLEIEDVPEVRLLLARTLRDVGDMDAAAREYARLAAEQPDNEALLLEWALAHAWAREYEQAARILGSALARVPDSVALRVELARVYYALGRVREAEAELAGLDDTTLAAAGALTLREDLRYALFVPPPPPDTTRPTRLELAARARVAGDIGAARALVAEAVAESPDDAEAWQAYADLLEYELADFEGARSALLEVERLRGQNVDRELRLARLEIWTGRNADAARRLEALVAALAASSADGTEDEAARAQRAEALALLGDLHRWDGDRVAAARSYRLALGEDAESERALAGLAALDAEITRQVVELEVPRRGGRAFSQADSDDFSRTDVGGEWIEVEPGGWVWGGTLGSRWLDGLDLDGLAADRQGIFVDLSGARWWRSGTIRTGASLGAERVRDEWDLTLGASLVHRGTRGRTTDLRYERGPAHPVTNTLQSVAAAVVQDRVSLGHTRALGGRGSIAASLDAAWLRAGSPGVADDGTARLSVSATASRGVAEGLSLGLTARALTFVDAAPAVTAPGSGTRPLFWDPRAAVSVGPFARLEHDLSTAWKVTGQLNPGLALVDERGARSSELVPHMSAEAGMLHEGPRMRAALDLFYYQGQFDGYRTYGLRLTVGARGILTSGGSP